jgi:histidine triad (HIT) family protein
MLQNNIHLLRKDFYLKGILLRKSSLYFFFLTLFLIPIINAQSVWSPPFRDQRIYLDSPSNDLWDLIHGKRLFTTRLHRETAHTIAFDNDIQQSKEHFLVVPKGPYISFPHFTTHASDKQILDFVREIALVAELKKLDQKGYRVICDHAINPGTNPLNNDANQQVSHFHVHVAGGEALGKPVVAQHVHMRIENVMTDLPFEFRHHTRDLLEFINKKKLTERSFAQEKMIAYRVPDAKSFGIPLLIGFTLLNHTDEPMFTSFHEFAKEAKVESLRAFFDFIKDFAALLGIHETGYRLIANSGADALQSSHSFFQVFIAGGTRLGPIVSNVYGNQLVVDAHSYPIKFQDYQVDYRHGLLRYHMPHEHLDAGEDINKFIKKIFLLLGTHSTLHHHC